MSNLENFGKRQNSFTGTFGTGQVKFITANETFVVPSGISSVRVRVWGAGGHNPTGGTAKGGGGGGGFAIKTITGLTSGSSIAVTVGTSGGASSSFGAYVSATGGSNSNTATGGAGGSGVGGDINNTGGSGGDNNNVNAYGAGGGGASYFGGGGNALDDPAQRSFGFIGGAVGASKSFSNTSTRPANNIRFYSDVRKFDSFDWSDLDYICTGASATDDYVTGTSLTENFNGAGGSGFVYGAFPAGGGGNPFGGMNTFGGGLVVVEY